MKGLRPFKVWTYKGEEYVNAFDFIRMELDSNSSDQLTGIKENADNSTFGLAVLVDILFKKNFLTESEVRKIAGREE